VNAASECACSQVEAPDGEELHPTVRPGERGPRYSCAITPNLRAAGLVTGDRVRVRPALVGDAAGASATAALRGVVTERLERRSVLARPVKASAPTRPLTPARPLSRWPLFSFRWSRGGRGRAPWKSFSFGGERRSSGAAPPSLSPSLRAPNESCLPECPTEGSKRVVISTKHNRRSPCLLLQALADLDVAALDAVGGERLLDLTSGRKVGPPLRRRWRGAR